MIIEQDDKKFTITMIRTDRDGMEDKRKFKYSLEGKKTKNKTDFGKQESIAKWLENGQALEIVSTMDVKREDMEFTMESVQTWSLSDGQLVIDSVRYSLIKIAAVHVLPVVTNVSDRVFRRSITVKTLLQRP